LLIGVASADRTVKISFLLSCKNGVQSDALIKCVVVQSHKQTQITIDALPLILAIMQQQGFKLSGELIKKCCDMESQANNAS
jgi:hypothetical protein